MRKTEFLDRQIAHATERKPPEHLLVCVCVCVCVISVSVSEVL